MEHKESLYSTEPEEGSLAYRAEAAWVDYNPDDLLAAINDGEEDTRLGGDHLDLVYRAFISGYLTATEDLLKGQDNGQ